MVKDSARADRSVVTVATWNMLADTGDLGRRLPLLAAGLAGADVALLQEVMFDPQRATSGAHVLAGLTGMRVAAVAYRPGPDGWVGTAVLTRLPVLGNGHVSGAASPADAPWSEPAHYASATVRTPGGWPLLVASVHLPWGEDREHRRLAHLRAVEDDLARIAEGEPSAVTVVGGDLNAVPDSDSVRYLTGRGTHAGHGSCWVDAWQQAGDGGPGFTHDPSVSNQSVDRMAGSVGALDMSLVPPRRIDYVLVRGWAHGRPGCPLAARVVGAEPSADGTHPSDHWGVMAELWDPPALEGQDTPVG